MDGVLFLQVIDAQRASYGIGDYIFGVTQLAQTTMRSEMGKIDLDKISSLSKVLDVKGAEQLEKIKTKKN